MPRQTQPGRSSDRSTGPHSSKQQKRTGANARKATKTKRWEKTKKNPGSVTRALARAHDGAPLDERVLAYLYKSLNQLVTSNRFKEDGLPLDGEDVLQDFLIGGVHTQVRKRRFERREDFAAFCASIVQKQFISQKRREFGTTGRRRLQRLTEENAADHSECGTGQSAADFAEQRKLCREINRITGKRLSQLDRLERVVICRWIRTADGEKRLHEYVQNYVQQRKLRDVEVPSQRTISRIVARFRRHIADVWKEAHGDTENVAEVLARMPGRKKKQRR